jgi:UDP-2,3-diacylglucosamine hydrolase
MWMKDYFQKEMNISLYFEPERFELFQKKFLIGHGDGLGPGDKGYKFIKYIFRNPLSKGMFSILPPRIGFAVATFFSRKSRAKTGSTDQVFLGEDKEWLVLYCKQVLQHEPIDYFIFGHRHLPLQIQLNEKSSYLNSGDWIKYNSYIELDQQTIQLKYYKL